MILDILAVLILTVAVVAVIWAIGWEILWKVLLTSAAVLWAVIRVIS